MHLLAVLEGAVLHAAGFVKNGRALVFPGVSGAGKTTLTRLLLCREGWDGLSDDRVAARKTSEGVFAFGTPWSGEAGLAENKGAPLAGLFFPERGEKEALEPLSPDKALQRLVKTASVPWYDKEALCQTLDFLGTLAICAPCHVLRFRPGGNIAEALEKAGF
jgi:hypothetical protein